MDKHSCFDALSQSERHDSFVIRAHIRSSGVAILAPHGGGIEPGTSEIAKAIAEVEHSYYSFEGRKRTGNQDLHITSTNFDEPKGLAMARQSERVVVIHGCFESRAIVYLGGRDKDLKEKLRHCLVEAAFQVEEHSDPNLQGMYLNNICNRSKNHRGVQVEIATGLRKLMFEDLNSRKGRERTKPIFAKFAGAIRQAISPPNYHLAEGRSKDARTP